ncbi:MAG: phosphatase PAP2 family protein [Clostridiaceae bacterium]|nr:phosphatase PAP2 family protein [Clostridiaceae bacterium]
MNLFNLVEESPLIGNMMVVITSWSSRIFALIYFIGIGVLLLRKSKQIIPFTIAPATAFIAVQFIRYIYLRPRPFVALDIESLINHAPNGSLPSMHTVSAFVIGMAIWHLHKRLGKYVLVLAAITGLSRVMVGVHYPLDILLGALLAIAISFSIFNIMGKQDESRKAIRGGEYHEST